ncbi:Zinc finger, CW-type [Dillenia turbinata]|uniref:Zinc finger, CW-type n=1 Tax=Dillenia turbinata TaxID=194707 RepID=A0AAN8W7G6_9MAGN
MASNKCMNGLCKTTSSIQWRKGWAVRPGEFATLCDNCGTAFEQFVFCEMFHINQSGWRNCISCGKRLHCGCIVSSTFYELLEDGGGVSCISCAKRLRLNAMKREEKLIGKPATDNVGELGSTSADIEIDGGSADKRMLMQLDRRSESMGFKNLLQSCNDGTNGLFGKMKHEEILLPPGEIARACLPNVNYASPQSSQTAKMEASKLGGGIEAIYETVPQTNLSITLAIPSGNPVLFPGVTADKKELSMTSSLFQQGSRSRHLLPMPPKSVLATGLESNAAMVPQIRVARPPAEGRGRNQLLPRYWPRITDQELQQISGDSNSTIVPLFEKVLSASDAGRIGRLVLPKACAEAYFPAINQPEGLPLKIQDVKGKEWSFQFRFWPNNNSRMYVLEGVTPCIQSMQLQAGDTVTFSRRDPEGQLVMGFRKASNTAAMQTLKGGADPTLSVLSWPLSSTTGDINWHQTEKLGGNASEGPLLTTMLGPEKKRSRNIGNKSKRLLIDSQDALELRLTWEEAQDLLRPPPSVKPKIVTIDDQEIEEYEEPPVFGKRSIFAIRFPGDQEQWTQCDNCSKWRRLPVDVLLPPKWSCADNNWDPSRSSCSALEELSPTELEHLLRLTNDFKRRKLAASGGLTPEHEPSGLDALANAAVLGDSTSEPGGTSVATTTKHPRHRDGCQCIVCIQPPSGKGKHKPTCTCIVCMTVKRRFKTLMMRKKKRQSEREAEIAQRNQQPWIPKDDSEVESTSRHVLLPLDPSENEMKFTTESSGEQHRNTSSKLVDGSKVQIDLNCDPEREEESEAGLPHVSMMSLLQEASFPLESYLKQNGLTSLVSEQQTCSGSHSLQQNAGENDGKLNDGRFLVSAVHEHENEEDEGHLEPEQEPEPRQSDP